MRVLLLEEDASRRRFMRDALAALGHRVDPTCEGENAQWFLRQHKYAIMIASDTCPGVDLVLAERHVNVSRIITSFKRSELACDRLLIKPFTETELVECVTALATKRPIRFDGLEIDIQFERVFRNHRAIAFSRQEFKLFEFLARRPGEVVARSEIVGHLFGHGTAAQSLQSNVVDVYIGYVRAKVGRDLIKTVRGEGYLFDPTAASAE